MKVKTPYNRIACSLNNSAAIDKNGEVYVWGLSKTGILGDNKHSNGYSPQCINIKKVDSQFKAIHISMGLNHIAVLVNYVVFDLVDTNVFPPQAIKPIVEAHTTHMNNEGIHILVAFEKKLINKKFIPKKDIEEYFKQRKFPLENASEKTKGFTKSQIEEFYDFFCGADETEFNLIEYFYQTNKTKIRKYQLIVWGLSDSGRLGLSENILDQAKSRKQGGKLAITNTEEDQNESQIIDDEEQEEAPNEPYAEFEKKVVKKTIHEGFKNEVRYVACGHHHTLVISSKGRIYFFGMGTQDWINHLLIINTLYSKGQLGNENFINVYQPTKLRIRPKQKFIQVACGSSHSLALAENGIIYSWGKNSKGQLGIGNRNDQLKPTIINTSILGIYIDCGDQHSGFISADKELYTWGSGQYFRLGHGVASDELSPKKVVVLEDVYVKHMSCGMTHTLAITNEGFVYAWGDGMNGKLGISEANKCVNLPTRVGVINPGFRKKVYYQVAAGGLHSLSLSDDGTLFSWGCSKGGVLGVGFTKDTKESYSTPQKIKEIEKMEAKNKKHIQFFSIKNYLKEQKEIEKYKLKEEEEQQDENQEVESDNQEADYQEEIQFIQNIYTLNIIFTALAPNLQIKRSEKKVDKQIIFAVTSTNNSFFVTENGHLFACGSVKKGMLVLDPKNSKILKKKKNQLTTSNPLYQGYFDQPQAVAQGNNTNMGKSFMQSQINPLLSTVGMNNKLSKIGSPAAVVNKDTKGGKQNSSQQDEELIFYFPYRIPYFKNKIVYLSCSETHCIAVSHKGVAYGWGNNEYYQLGLGYHCKYNFIPTKIQGALETKRIIMSTCSNRFSGLLTDKGEVWTFGTSDSGVLGHEEKTYYVVNEPKMINDIPPMIYLTSGPQGMMAISANNKFIYAWGNNLYGQLGIQIANNKVGNNNLGDDELENIDLDDQNKKITKNQIIFHPKKVNYENDRKIPMVYVSMGMFHSVAIDYSNHLYSCGLKKFSGLAKSVTPEALKGFDDMFTFLDHNQIRNQKFIHVSASEFHTLAISKGSDENSPNRVFGWGMCNLGNLCQNSSEEIMQSLYTMKYEFPDIDPVDPFETNVLLPVDLSLLGKFNQNVQDMQSSDDRQANYQDIVYVSAGIQHNIAVDRNGKVLTWGVFSNGRLGIMNQDDTQYTPSPNIISVLFKEQQQQETGGIDVFNGSVQDPSVKPSGKSKLNTGSEKTGQKSRSSKPTKKANASQPAEENAEQLNQEEEDLENEELDVLEQTSYGSDSSRDDESEASDQENQQDQEANSFLHDDFPNFDGNLK